MSKKKPLPINTGKHSMTVAEMASLGGKARAKRLSKKRRKEIGRMAALARWGKSKSASQHAEK